MGQILRIPEVGLVAALRLVLPGADQRNVHAVLQNILHRNPVRSRAFHRHAGAALAVGFNAMSHCFSFFSSGTVVPNARVVTSPSLSAGPTTRATASSLLPTSIPAHRSLTAGISIVILLLDCEASSRRIVYTLPLGPLQAPIRG